MEWKEIEELIPKLLKRAEQAAWAGVQDRDLVDEAVAHTQEKLWELRDLLKREKLFSWVGAVAYNKAIDEGRHRRRHVGLGSTLGTSGEPRWAAKLPKLRPEFTMSDQVAFEEGRKAALSLLPPKQASALRLHLDGLAGPEIARRLRISEAAARKRIHDAKRSLRAALGDAADGFLPRQDRGW